MKNCIELGISGNINEFKFAVETILQEKIKSNLMEKKAEVAKTLFTENCCEYKPFHGDKKKEEKAKKFADQYKKKRDAYRELMTARKANEEVEDITETLSVSSGVKTWIDDFIKSNAPQFEGKSRKERINMAVAAFNAAKSKNEK